MSEAQSLEMMPVNGAPAAPLETNILTVIERATRDPSVDVAKMERLMALAEQVHQRQAEAAYHDAMNIAQSEMRPISRDSHNPQTRSKYASYQAIDEAIRPIYTAHGFAMSFGSKASPHADRLIVTCQVSHRAGHKVIHELEVPADGKGAKGGDVMTKTHAVGSGLSYGQRYLAKLIWNLSFGEVDDDGNAASPRKPAPEKPTQPKAPETPKEPLIDRFLKKTEGLHDALRVIAEEQGWIEPNWTLNAIPEEHLPRTKAQFDAMLDKLKSIQSQIPHNA